MKKLRIIIPIILIIALSVPTYAASWTSKANGNSKAIYYNLTANATRTSATNVKITWNLAVSPDPLGEGHGSPTHTTATLKCGGWKHTLTIKRKGSNNLSGGSGTFNVTVGPKDTQVAMSIEADGSGSYTTQRTEAYTYYTTETRKKWVSTKTAYTQYAAVQNNGANGFEYLTGWLSSRSAAQAVANAHYRGYVKTRTQYRTDGKYVNYTVQVPHTGYRTVTDTHYTNSGTLDKKYIYPTFPAWIYVNYNTLGGSPVPSQQGFIYNQGTRTTTTVPQWWAAEIQKYAYECKGWTKSYYTLDALRDPNYSVNPQYGTTGASVVYADHPTTDVTLYAAYEPKYVANIVYHGNGTTAEETAKITNIPEPQRKKYKVDVQLSSQIPIYPDTENKGKRHVFLWWNTKKDGTGYSYKAGSTFDLNYNPHEPVPQGKGQDSLNLYAIWYDGTTITTGEEIAEDKTNPNLRYIDKEHQNSLTKNSKWRTGERQRQLEESLNKEGTQAAKRVYNSEGVVIRENN